MTRERAQAQVLQPWVSERRSTTTYKFRLYPTRQQEEKLDETVETCRRLYNSLLAERMETRTGVFDQMHLITQRRAEDKFLKQVQSHVLQDVAKRLDKAYGAFFAKLSRYPRFRRNARYNSLTFDYTGFSLHANRLRLSMIGDVRLLLHRPLLGTPKRVTVVKDIDQWYACVSCETESPKGVEPRREGPTAVGVDLGVLKLATLSTGLVFENPRNLDNSVVRIMSLQRRLSRKRKGSANREKAKVSLAKAWRKVRNQRLDVAHKVSHKLASEHSTIVFEDLKILNMVKNHNLASAIMDASWGQLRRLTAYKAEKRGGRVMLVNPSGTSQKCSRCGNVQDMPLSERVFSCERCGLVLDRDVNAARNILQAGLERAHVEAAPLLVQRRRISKFGR